MFAETLRDIADRLKEIDAVVIVGLDGLPIEKVVLNPAVNIELLLAEFTNILRNAMQTSEEVDAGSIQEIIILSSKLIFLMKAITPEYFLMMILPEDGNLGRARFELKKAKYILEKELV